jgi:Protein of unknown function (DUF3551)
MAYRFGGTYFETVRGVADQSNTISDCLMSPRLAVSLSANPGPPPHNSETPFRREAPFPGAAIDYNSGMRRTSGRRTSRLLAAATFSSVLLLFATPGHAGTIGNAPWCAVQNVGTGDVIWDCEFRSAEQCQPAVIAGNRGFCNLNPAWPQYQPVPPPARHHKYRHYQ